MKVENPTSEYVILDVAMATQLGTKDSFEDRIVTFIKAFRVVYHTNPECGFRGISDSAYAEFNNHPFQFL